MWSEMGKRGSGFWSVTRYEDLRSVELNPAVFSSERGSINMAIQPRENWKPAILMEAAMNSLINLDAPRHMEMRMQQLDFFIPRYVAELKEKVEKKVSELLDNVEANGPEVDFVTVSYTHLTLPTKLSV